MTLEESISEQFTKFRCKTHNAGPFSIDEINPSTKQKIHDFHKDLDCEIEYLTDDQAWNLTKPKPDPIVDTVNFINDSILKSEKKENQKDILEEIISLISKTVKGDRNLVCQILFYGFSAFTEKPIQLMIMEKTSEGKTYPALQIIKHFPKENVLILGSATPQVFKYEFGTLVDKNYDPIQKRLDVLDENIEQARKSKDKNAERELENQRKGLLQESKTLIDLRQKLIIFKEPPNHGLLEALYSTLSSDEEYNEHKFVNKSNTGKNQNFTVVLRGCPAVLICTSRDESKNVRWLETYSRFNIVSPISTPSKYAEGMDLIAKTCSLPKELYAEFVISEKEKQRLEELINKVIERIKESVGETFNPFSDILAKEFPHEVGIRWRQFQRFLKLITIHCLCYTNHRPELLINGRKIPVITKADVEWTLGMIKDGTTIPPNKITWYKEVFLPAWKKYKQEVDFGKSSDASIEREVVTSNDIVKYMDELGKGKPTTKQIRETYLETLFDNGLIEKDTDPRNRSRDTYWPAEGYDSIKSSLIATSSLDESCVKSFTEKYVQRRFSFEVRDRILSQEEVIPYILSSKNVTQDITIEPKNDNGEATISDDSNNTSSMGKNRLCK